MRRVKVEVFQSDNGEWHWHLKARNSEVLSQAEGFSSKQKCLNNIALVHDAFESNPTIEFRSRNE